MISAGPLPCTAVHRTSGGAKFAGLSLLRIASQNAYPVLVGCKLLNNKFLVDAGEVERETAQRPHPTRLFDDEMRKDPKAFLKNTIKITNEEISRYENRYPKQRKRQLFDQTFAAMSPRRAVR